jgi:hypothetical protein
MMARKPIRGRLVLEWLADELPPYALKHLADAFRGDEAAAEMLCGAAPNKWRGLIAYGAFHAGVPQPAYREILRSVWNHDHLDLLRVLSNRRSYIRKMMAAAEFDHPFSSPITIWRGVEGGGARAAAGLSWTTDRDVAGFFALRSQAGRGKPLVFVANASHEDIVFWDDSREEREVILRHQPDLRPDPNPETWQAAMDRCLERRSVANTRSVP